MRLLFVMMLLAQVHADCINITKSTNECCGDENKKCDWVDHCISNEDGDKVCRFDGLWILWFILMALGVWILISIGDCLWRDYKTSKNAAAVATNTNAGFRAGRRVRYELNL